MSNYVLILIWLVAVAFISHVVKLKRTEMVCEKEETRYYFIWALIVLIPIILMAGSRTYFGDTEAYRRTFLSIPPDFNSFFDYFSTIEKDKGFTVFSFVIKLIIGSRDTLYFYLIALIQGLCLVAVYRKYSTKYLISIFLFIASTDYLSWMFNGMRQFLVVAVLFACMGLILKRKYIPLILIICLMATIHGSAWIVLPIIFVVQGEAWNKKTMFFIVCVVVAITFVGQFTTLLGSASADTQYSDILTNGIWETDDGTSFLRVLVYSVPAILSFFGRKTIRSANDPVINLCTNMSIVAAGIYIVSMFTSGIYIGRVPIYFSLYSYILLPWELDHLFDKKVSRLVYLAMIAAYLLFYYYQMHFTWSIL